MNRLAFCAVLIAASLLSAMSVRAEPITWSVEDRYRLFDEAGASRERVDTLLRDLQTRRAQGRPMSESYRDILLTVAGSDAADLRQSNWSPQSRTYDADYLYPATYRVRARLTDAPPGQCVWRVDGTEVANQSCQSEVFLSLTAGPVAEGWGGRGEVEVTPTEGLPIQQTLQMRDLLIVAMGDSFISGEGNPDVPADLSRLTPQRDRRTVNWPADLDPATDDLAIAQWWDEPCHRSMLSWPVATTLAWASDDPQRAITLVHVGCSGAEIRDGLVGGQSGLPGCAEGALPRRTCPAEGSEGRPQVAQVRALIGQGGRPIDRVLLSIGGNDIGFVGVIGFGLLPPNGYRTGDWVVEPLGAEAGVVCPDEHVADLLAAACSGPTAAQRLRTNLPADYRHLRAELNRLGAPPAKVVQTQYPDILRYNREGDFCHHSWRQTSISAQTDPRLAGLHRAFAAQNPALVVPAGFEVSQAEIPALVRGKRRWSFQFDMEPGFRCSEAPSGDRNIHRDGSDVCGAFRTWLGLNNAVAANGQGADAWTVVSGHLNETRGHGWCRGDAQYPLDMPVAGRRPFTWRFWDRPYDRWIFDRDPRDLQGESGQALRIAALAGPGAYEPYDFDQPRWFRTSVDSFRTQYGGPKRIIQGTVHPTYRTHIAYSDAVLNESPPLPR